VQCVRRGEGKAPRSAHPSTKLTSDTAAVKPARRAGQSTVAPREAAYTPYRVSSRIPQSPVFRAEATAPAAPALASVTSRTRVAA